MNHEVFDGLLWRLGRACAPRANPSPLSVQLGARGGECSVRDYSAIAPAIRLSQ